MTADEQDLLNRVEGLIYSKQFRQARKLLESLDDPTREIWLQKIDKVESQQNEVFINQEEKHKRLEHAPWEPLWIAVMSFVMTSIVAGLILAWNWRRLGKPQWSIWTALAAIILPVISIGSIIIGAEQIKPEVAINANTQMFFVIIMFAVLMMNILFPFWLGFIQHGSYQAWKNEGVEAMLSHPYNWSKSLVVYSAMVIVLSSVMGILTTNNIELAQFETELMRVEYSANWMPFNLQEDAGCLEAQAEEYYECTLLLAHQPYQFYWIEFAEETYDPSWSAVELADSHWNYLQGLEGVTPHERSTMIISGLTAETVSLWSIDELDGEEFYERYIYVVSGNDVLRIAIQAETKGIFDEDWHQVEKILKSIQIRPVD